MDLSVTVLHESINKKVEGCLVFKPVRILFGYYNELDKTFLDIFSKRKYVSLRSAAQLGIPEGFRGTYNINELYQKFGKKNIFNKRKFSEEMFFQVLEEYWLSVVKDVRGFDGDDIKTMPVKRYIDEFGELKNDDFYNSRLEALFNNDISISDYLTSVYQNYDIVLPTNNNFSNINDVCDFVKRRVINQDVAIKQIVTSIFRSRLFTYENNKSSTLLIGPSGVGKTEIMKSLAKCLDIPITFINASRLTNNGYKGYNPDEIILDIYLNANKNVEVAEKSILFIDEIDKKVDKDSSNSFNKTDVLHSLLKLMEGDIYNYSDKNYDFRLDTTNIIVVLAGAFSNIYNNKTNKIGFNSSIETNNQQVIDGDVLKSYGVPIEFLGRIRDIIILNSLQVKDLYNILKTSELSPMKYYIDNFKRMGIDIVVPDSVYMYVAEKAYSLGTNARGLNSLVDKIFSDVLFEVFSDSSNIDKILINEGGGYTLVRKKRC